MGWLLASALAQSLHRIWARRRRRRIRRGRAYLRFRAFSLVRSWRVVMGGSFGVGQDFSLLVLLQG